MATKVSQRNAASTPATARRALPGFTDQLIEPLSRLRGEVDRLFEDFPFRFPTLRFGGEFAVTVPALEMTETKKAYKLSAELPGIEAKDVEVSVEDGMLRIAGEKKTERDEDEQGYRLSERSYGAFERLIRLPSGADTAKIKARSKDGVLTITIPKKESSQAGARSIAIEAN